MFYLKISAIGNMFGEGCLDMRLGRRGWKI